MVESIKGKKIELSAYEPAANEVICETCDGIGRVLKAGVLEQCPDCYRGVRKVCPECGTVMARGYTYCNQPSCRAKREATDFAKRLEKAKKIKASDPIAVAMGMFCSEDITYNDGYFFSWEDFFDSLDGRMELDIDRPRYVWGTVASSIKFDAGSIIENACDDLHEDASSDIPDSDIAELQKYLDEWCNRQANATKSYMVDYEYAIEIPWEEYDY